MYSGPHHGGCVLPEVGRQRVGNDAVARTHDDASLQGRCAWPHGSAATREAGDTSTTAACDSQRHHGPAAARCLLLRSRRFATAWVVLDSFSCSTPRCAPRSNHCVNKIQLRGVAVRQTNRCHSMPDAMHLRRSRAIRENIIGRSVIPAAAVRARVRQDVGWVRGGRALTVLHQPARQQRRGVFFNPGIKQLTDLFPQIRGVTQSRQLIALQGITGSREEKLPRRLGPIVQRGLQGSGPTLTS